MKKKFVGALVATVVGFGMTGCGANVEDQFFDYWIDNTSRGIVYEYNAAKDKAAYKSMVVAAGYDICDEVESYGFSMSYFINFMKSNNADVGTISIPLAAGKFLCPEIW